MTDLIGIYYDLARRADSARRRNEDLVMELEEAIALHEAIRGSKVPYQHPETFLGVPVRVLDPDRVRFVVRNPDDH